VISIDCDFIVIAARVMESKCCRSVLPEARARHFRRGPRVPASRPRADSKRSPASVILRVRDVLLTSRTPSDVSSCCSRWLTVCEQTGANGSVYTRFATTLVLLL
jgi:hypothetical protein